MADESTISFALPSLSAAPARLPKTIRPPSGYEDHLSRRAAAAVLGFASVFKVRQLEKEGRLRPVRGAMGSAWYSPAQVTALRRAAAAGPASRPRADALTWSDAALIAHLREFAEAPGGARRARTIVDLVADTGIPIARAERVYRFWLTHDSHPAADAARAARGLSAPAQGSAERRGGERLERDALLRQMRDPDPKVRAAAFARLKQRG